MQIDVSLKENKLIDYHLIDYYHKLISDYHLPIFPMFKISKNFCALVQEENSVNQENWWVMEYETKIIFLLVWPIAAKKSIVTFTTNSKVTVKLTRISVTDAQLTKVWRHSLKAI